MTTARVRAITTTGALRPPAGGLDESESFRTGLTVIGLGPISDIAVGNGSGTLVAANYHDNTVSVIGVGDRGARATLAIAGEPLLVAAADDRAYVASTSAVHDLVSVIDTASGDVTAIHPLHPVEYGVTAIRADPHARRAFVGLSGPDSARLAVIDPTLDHVEAIDIATGPGLVVEALAAGAVGVVFAAVSDPATSHLYLIDSCVGEVIGTVPIGAPIRDIAMASDRHTVYVLTYDPRSGGALTVVDAAHQRVVTTAAIGGSPTQLALNSGSRLYLVDGDNVDVISTETHQLTGTIAAAVTPSCVAASHDDLLHIADYSGAVTTVYETAPAAGAMSAEASTSADLAELPASA